MKNIVFVFLFITICFTGSLSAQSTYGEKLSDDKQIEVLKKLSEVSSDFNTVKCEFTQEKTISILTETAVSKGIMYYSSPNKLRWEYISPKQYCLIMNGNDIAIKVGKIINKFDAKKNKSVVGMISMIVSSLNGTGFNDDSFDISVFQDDTYYSVVMIPTQEKMKSVIEQTVLFFDSTFKVFSIDVVDMNGDKTKINLTSRKINDDIPSNLFDVK